jgi:excisionase family DNA binding protein
MENLGQTVAEAIEAEVRRRVSDALEERAHVPVVFTVDETAEKLKVSRSTVYKMIADGELTRAAVRAKVLIPASEVARVLGSAA